MSKHKKRKSKIKRTIPATMATQHPDHAGVPFWHHQELITTQDEIKECYINFSCLGISEYKWDWEGKFVDEAVIEKLLNQYQEFFVKNPIGKKKFLTLRVPNPEVETECRLGRAFMGMLTAANLAKSLKLHHNPLFEAILPMTENANQMIELQMAFNELRKLKHPLFGFHSHHQLVEIIPLFEQTDVILDSAEIIKNYLGIHQRKFGFTPSYLRPYCARSDPALNSGLVATILAIKIAFSKYQKLEKELNIKLFPIVGTGSLPFRGSLSPDRVGEFLTEYSGLRTAVIQSAFRYDYPLAKVKKAIKELNEKIPQTKTKILSQEEIIKTQKLIKIFESHYKPTIEKIAPIINKIANFIPKRRERMLHIGLFGYSRGVGRVHLPRAITFTACLYSLGIPPEFIGTGRGLAEAQKIGDLDLVKKLYINMREDLIRAGYFINFDSLDKLSKKDSVFEEIKNDLKLIEKLVAIKLGPRTKLHQEHKVLSDHMYSCLLHGIPFSDIITRMARLRKSMG